MEAIRLKTNISRPGSS